MTTDAASVRRRLPLTVIGGFLGAGKTTFVNRVLRATGGRRLAVLVNDFGAINVDASLIARSSGDTIALTNGCVCCSIGDDLTAALIAVIESPDPFDAIVVEASGVSDPWRIAEVGRADPALSLDGVIVLVDADACLRQAADPLLADSLERQVRSADLLVVNKTDRVDAATLIRTRAWLEGLAARTPRIETTHAEVPLPLVFGDALWGCRESGSDAGSLVARTRRREPDECDDAHAHAHPRDAVLHDHDALFATWSSRPRRAFAVERLRALVGAMPAGVLRLKGLVRTDEFGWTEVQFAGRHGSVRRATAPSRVERHAEADAEAAIVAIGVRATVDAHASFDVLGEALDAAQVERATPA